MKFLDVPLFAIFTVVPALVPAQIACDSLFIVSLEHAPFTTTALQLIVENHGSSSFTSPFFSLIDAEGDTIAREQPYFFGLGIVPTAHRLDLLSGASLPTSPFEGTLVLGYVTINGEMFCEIPVNVDLCPPGACIDMWVILHNTAGGIMDTTSFEWSIIDDQQQIVGSGILEVDTTGLQGITAQLCLEPGEYELEVAQIGSNGTNFSTGVGQGHYQLWGPYEPFEAGGSIQIAFSYYISCAAAGMSIPEIATTGLQLIVRDRTLIIKDPNNEPLGLLAIMDVSGKKVRSVSASGSELTLILEDLASGIYLVDPVTRSGAAQRFLIE